MSWKFSLWPPYLNKVYFFFNAVQFINFCLWLVIPCKNNGYYLYYPLNTLLCDSLYLILKTTWSYFLHKWCDLRIKFCFVFFPYFLAHLHLCCVSDGIYILFHSSFFFLLELLSLDFCSTIISLDSIIGSVFICSLSSMPWLLLVVVTSIIILQSTEVIHKHTLPSLSSTHTDGISLCVTESVVNIRENWLLFSNQHRNMIYQSIYFF